MAKDKLTDRDVTTLIMSLMDRRRMIDREIATVTSLLVDKNDHSMSDVLDYWNKELVKVQTASEHLGWRL